MVRLTKDKNRIDSGLIQATRETPEDIHVKIASSYINYYISVRNIWLILDNALGIEKKVNSL